MYNKDRKEAFINDDKYDFTDSVKAFLTSIFTKSEEIESTQNTDLADFNQEQITVLLKYFNSTSRSYLRLVCYHFENYYNWCVNNSHVEKYNIQAPYDFKILSNVIDKIVPTKMVSDKYFSKDDFIKYVDNVYDKSTKFMLYAIFMNCFGKNGESLARIKLSDIDIANKTVILNTGKVVKVDQKFIDLAIAADRETCYLENEDSLFNVRGNNVYYESIYILKVCKSRHQSDTISYGTILARVGSAKEQAGNQYLTPANITFNGMVNKIKERLFETGITLEEAFESKDSGSSGKNIYKEVIDEVIQEYGFKMKTADLKYRIKDFMDCYND